MLFFVGLAYALASQLDGRVSRSLSSLAVSETHKCVRSRNEDVDEPVNASRAASQVRRPPDASVATFQGTHAIATPTHRTA